MPRSFKTGIAKWFVSFLHGLFETRGGGATLEVVSFFRVARDAIENGTFNEFRYSFVARYRNRDLDLVAP